MSTVIGTFQGKGQAEQAVRQLRDKGFTEEEISIVAKGQGQDQGRGRGDDGADITDQAAAGATWGGVLGGAAGLLASVGALAIPGIGPIVAAGPLAATLTGAAGGGLAGGLLDLGIPAERGQYYEGEVKRGRVLAVVETEVGMVEDAARILRDNGAADVEVH